MFHNSSKYVLLDMSPPLWVEYSSAAFCYLVSTQYTEDVFELAKSRGNSADRAIRGSLLIP